MMNFADLAQGWGVAVLVGVPNKDDAFKTHPVNFLNERTLKGTFFGNYKPRTDLPSVVEKYMNKVKHHILPYRLGFINFILYLLVVGTCHAMPCSKIIIDRYFTIKWRGCTFQMVLFLVYWHSNLINHIPV